jgi:hypothetical protein
VAIEIDTSLPARRVRRVLERLADWRGMPRGLRIDNGPELIAQELANWCEDRGIDMRYVQPASPTSVFLLPESPVTLGVLGFDQANVVCSGLDPSRRRALIWQPTVGRCRGRHCRHLPGRPSFLLFHAPLLDIMSSTSNMDGLVGC